MLWLNTTSVEIATHGPPLKRTSTLKVLHFRLMSLKTASQRRIVQPYSRMFWLSVKVLHTSAIRRRRSHVDSTSISISCRFLFWLTGVPKWVPFFLRCVSTKHLCLRLVYIFSYDVKYMLVLKELRAIPACGTVCFYVHTNLCATFKHKIIYPQRS